LILFNFRIDLLTNYNRMTQKIDLPMRKALFVIDDFIMNTLKVDEKRLPWRHETNEEDSFIELISLIRLSCVRVFSEYEKRYYKKPLQ